MRRWILIFMALGLLPYAAIAAEPSVIEHPDWKRMPTPKIMARFSPISTDDDYVGMVDLICRIRDAMGHVTCQTIGMSPIGSQSWADFARRSMDVGAQVNTRTTPGAHPGALVHMVWHFEDEE